MCQVARPRWQTQQPVRAAAQHGAGGLQGMQGGQMRHPRPAQPHVQAGSNARPMTGMASSQMPPTQQRQYQYKQGIRHRQNQVAMMEQKQMLGERLFPLIQQEHPETAGKITGMLLEITNSELLHMLESREFLKAKVGEAVAVLSAHQAKEASRVAPVKKEPA